MVLRDEEIRYNVVAALANLSNNAAALALCAPADLASILELLVVDHKPMATAAKNIHSLCLVVLANLLSIRELHEASVKAGIPALIARFSRFLSFRDTRVAAQGLQSICSTADPSLLSACIEQGVVPAISDCLGILQAVVRAARDMAPTIEEAAMSFEQRVHLRLACNPEHICALLSGALFHVCTIGPSIDRVIADGGAHILAEILRTTLRYVILSIAWCYSCTDLVQRFHVTYRNQRINFAVHVQDVSCSNFAI